MLTGIYEIRHIASGKRYIGSAVNFSARWSVHRHHLDRHSHHNPILQAAWNKYGENAFVFNKLIVCKREDLLLYEQRAIDGYKPKYNACPTAGNSLGYKHTEETKAKFPHRRKTPITPEWRMKISAANKGKVISKDTREKIAASLRGKPHSEERRANESRAQMGKKQSPETIAKRIATIKANKLAAKNAMI